MNNDNIIKYKLFGIIIIFNIIGFFLIYYFRKKICYFVEIT